MYSSGYVPPQPPTERKRRSERNAAAGMPVTPRAAGADMSSARTASANAANMAQRMPSGAQRAYQPYAGQGAPGQQGYAPQPQEGWIPPAAQPHQPQEAWGYPQSQYPGMQPQQRPWQGQNGYTPPPQPPAQKPPRSSGGGKPPRGPLFRVLLVLACVALVAALCVGGYYGMQEYSLRQYVTAYDKAYCQGVYVDGIHLGGMTQQQAYDAVSEKARQRSDAWSVRLTYQGQLVVEITADQLGMTVDVTAPLQQAWSRGHTGSVHQRRDDMEALLQKPYEGYTALPGGDTSVVDYLLEEIAVAEGSLSKKTEFITKYCNLKQNSSLAWLPAKVVEEARGMMPQISDFRGCYCVGGIDLSQTTDLTACCVVIEKGEKLYVFTKFFMPREKIDEATARDGLPYRKYVQLGIVTESGENMVDYEDCYRWFVELVEKHKIYPLKVGYDRYSALELVKRMENYGFHMESVYQGENLTGVINLTEGTAKDGRFAIGDNDLMAVHMLNSALKRNAETGRKKLIKLRATDRIDGMASLLDAMCMRQVYNEELGEQLRNKRAA